MELVFVNPTDKGKDKAQDCGCTIKISDGGGEYSDVYRVSLCKKHSGVEYDKCVECQKKYEETIDDLNGKVS